CYDGCWMLHRVLLGWRATCPLTTPENLFSDPPHPAARPARKIRDRRSRRSSAALRAGADFGNASDERSPAAAPNPQVLAPPLMADQGRERQPDAPSPEPSQDAALSQ